MSLVVLLAGGMGAEAFGQKPTGTARVQSAFDPGTQANGDFPQPLSAGGPLPPGVYPYQYQYTGNPASHHAIYAYPPAQAELPPQFGPWPGISPFEDHFSQHRNLGGLWFHDSNRRGPKYTFGVEYLWATLRGPNSELVGSPGVNTYSEYLLRLSRLSSDDDIDEEEISDFLANFQDADGNQLFPYFDPVVAGDKIDEVDTNGVRVQWGITDPDDSGFFLTGWWASGFENFDANEFATRPSGDLDRIRDIFEVFAFQAELPSDDPLVIAAQGVYANLGGLPLDDGSGAFGGVTVPFDLEFRLDFKSQAGQITGEFLLTPLIKRKSAMLRPLWGVHYMYLHEEFRFFGRDSGIVYNTSDDVLIPEFKEISVPNGVDDDGDGIIDDAIRSEEVGDDTAIFAFPDPFTAYLDSDTRSHMVGPAIGLRYDIGGEDFKVFGFTKVGALANFERIDISGDNIGHKIRALRTVDGVQPIEDSDLLEPTPDNPRPNAFEDAERHAHFSPLFEQSIFVEAPIFKHIPLLKKVNFLESAKVRGGWTYIAVYEVIKPVDSIVWQGNPSEGLFPYVKTKRDKWHTSNFSLGIYWEY